MGPLPSPRLPGVFMLRTDATGPEYGRWKREIKSAFTAKGTWGHCDGSIPMPMPGAGPNFFSPVSQPDMQTTLLEDRKAWVKRDREVKLDIFLSVSDDIKLEVFEVGPPLPPSAMTAKEMLDALDNHYDGFKFEDYHHVFCHFLNLHIDQYTNIEEFNAEFQATLDDLLDHGHPLSNMQACSAYFSKLRCTQNPWVAKQIKAWDNRDQEPQLAQLMRKSPPWSIIRPLAMSTKAAPQTSMPQSIPEEPLVDTPPHSDGEDTPSERSISTISSKPSHSRDISNVTTRSQEITIHASYDDLTDFQLEAFPEVPTGIPALAQIPKRMSSISISKLSLHSLPPINRPLPPIPTSAERSRSASPKAGATKARTKNAKPPTRLPSPTTSLPGLEQAHPTMRSPLPRTEPMVEPTLAPEQLEMHPAMRQPSSPPPARHSLSPRAAKTLSMAGPEVVVDDTPTHITGVIRDFTLSPPLGSLATSPDLGSLAAPTFSSDNRPTSSRSAAAPQDGFSNWSQTRPLLRIDSETSSVTSLPIQGTTRSVTPDPEFSDTTIIESSSTTPSKPLSRIELAKQKFEGKTGGLLAPSDETKKARKRSFGIKARLSPRHGIREITDV